MLEDVLLGRVIDCLLKHLPDTLDLDRLPERGIGFVPVPFIGPVLIIREAVHDRIKRVIDLPARHDIQRLHMELVADAFLIRTCGRDQEVERLFPGITGALGQNIVQLPVGLRMDLVKHHSFRLGCAWTSSNTSPETFRPCLVPTSADST